jgi:peptide/nickel transport system permease protein
MVYARDYLVGLGGNFVSNWWVFLPITLALILFSVGWNLLGDGLNDMLNPRTR